MHISKLNIFNYRLLKNTSIHCEENLSLIIGKNNSGKTSLLSILSKCMGSADNVDKFEYFDFSISFQKKLYHAVHGSEKFERNELTGIRMDVYIEYNENDNLANISGLMLDLDPANRTIILRYDYTLNETIEKVAEEFENFKTDKNHLSQEDAFEKFMEKKYKKYFGLKKYSVLFDYRKAQINEDVYIFLDNKEINLSKIISFRYISARRDVSNSDADELSSLSASYYTKTKDLNEENNIVSRLENQIGETDKEFDDIYKEVFHSLMKKISRFGGIRENDTNLKVISKIREDRLLKDNTTVIYEDGASYLPENYNGLGYLNLISMIIKIETLLSDFRKDTKQDEEPADINLLFIEEPEAHTHPQMQYVFIKNIKALLKEGKKLEDSDREINLQTIMTTHSSHIVAESSFDDIKYFTKQKSDISCVSAKNLSDLEIDYQKEVGRESNHFKFLKQYLTLNRSEIFFADKIILIEGDTERILLPAMMRKMDQENNYKMPLLSQNISIIEVGNYSEIFSEFIQFLGTKTLIITDIDTYKYKALKDEKGAYKLTKSTKKRIYQPDKHPVKKSDFSSNSSLRFFYFNGVSKIRTKWLISMNKNQKILSAEKIKWNNKKRKMLCGQNSGSSIQRQRMLDAQKTKWKANPSGELMVVFQIPEKNSDGVEYNARSFEDAFFHINRDFFTDFSGNKKEKAEKCRAAFQGLQKTELFFNNQSDSYDLADQCVKRKPSLAMDILLNSRSENGKDFINWKIPAYIREGLEWLQKD